MTRKRSLDPSIRRRVRKAIADANTTLRAVVEKIPAETKAAITKIAEELKADQDDAPASAPASPAQTPKTPQRQRHGPQFDRTVRALRKLFPQGVPADMRVETVRGRVLTELAEESRRLGKADPSWKVVDAAIEFLGRSD